MFNWPTAVVVVAVLAAAITWYRTPYVKRRVGALEITVRGEKARALIRQFEDQSRRELEAAGGAPASHFRRGGTDAAA